MTLLSNNNVIYCRMDVLIVPGRVAGRPAAVQTNGSRRLNLVVKTLVKPHVYSNSDRLDDVLVRYSGELHMGPQIVISNVINANYTIRIFNYSIFNMR